MTLMQIAAAVALSLAGIVSADEKPADALKSLQGRWQPTEVVWNGKKVDQADWLQLAWDFEGDKVGILMQGKTSFDNYFSNYYLNVDASAKVATMDLSRPNSKIGFIAIFKLNGD